MRCGCNFRKAPVAPCLYRSPRLYFSLMELDHLRTGFGFLFFFIPLPFFCSFFISFYGFLGFLSGVGWFRFLSIWLLSLEIYEEGGLGCFALDQ